MKFKDTFFGKWGGSLAHSVSKRLTFPGSSLPNAMVQLSPVTEYGSGAGYEYEDDVILGFTHTNKGHWNLCNIPILPLSKPGETYAAHFSHQKESAAPGYYQVYLDNYNVDVKLTSTLRCGYHQYAFRDNANRQVLFDLGRANNRCRAGLSSRPGRWRCRVTSKWASASISTPA